MTVADLDLTHHKATIVGDLIQVEDMDLSPEDFVLSGLLLVEYDEREERELVRLGLLAGCRQVG